MKKAEKIQQTDELRENLSKAIGFFVTDYRGVEATDLTQLRFALNKHDARLKIVKNRLTLRAIADPEVAKQLETHIDNMTAVTMVYGDLAGSAKALKDFAKQHESLKIRAGYVEGQVIDEAGVRALADLPPREVLLAQLLGALNAVPTGFVRVLNALPTKWVQLLEAVRQKNAES
jgi:large subunit ribosomal protein L10